MRLVVFHVTVREGEERPIAADADVLAGVQFAAALTDEDVAGEDGLAAKFFDPEPFLVALAAVDGCALTFFVRHGEWFP